MASVSELHICKTCQEFLVDGFCPSGHKQPGRISEEWPDSYQRPVTISGQLGKKKTAEKGGEKARTNILKAEAESKVAYENLTDAEAMNLLADASEIVRHMLAHKRGQNFMRNATTVARGMLGAAEAIENYIRMTGTVDVSVRLNSPQDEVTYGREVGQVCP